MENSKVKALFFSNYYGQKILRWHQWVDDEESSVVDFQVPMSKFGVDDGWYLLLRAVDQLTDEECLQICNIYDSSCKWTIKERQSMCILFESEVELLWLFKDHSEPIFCCEDKKGGENSPYNILAAYDYLRSIGVLLPFTYLDENGKPQTLQPDEIVARGWAKVQSSNDK